MLLSMTGFGEAHRQQDGLTVVVEVRTINSRYFKLTMRCGDAYSSLEPELEEVVRRHVKRGTIQVSLRVDRPKSLEDYKVNKVALTAYRDQLASLHREWHISESIDLEKLLLLPGVVEEQAPKIADVTADLPLITATLDAALENLAHMRTEEGRAMTDDLLANIDLISAALGEIEQRAPLVATSYRARLEERLRKTLAEFEVTLDPSDIIKEVSIFSERSDISEEIVRLRSHLDQFRATVELPESSGRKLEFLTQEMFRETNTIGSKANDVEITKQVIEVKAAIEKIREMIQNVE